MNATRQRRLQCPKCRRARSSDGATGAIIATDAIDDLQRISGRQALVTASIGGGPRITAIFERT